MIRLSRAGVSPDPWRALLLLPIVAFCASPLLAGGRSALSFQERVDARTEVERLYHSWRTGSAASFEEAVPREVITGRVRRSLAMGAALEQRWKLRITARMLGGELGRMERGSRSPRRLERLLAAMDGDRALAAEVLARPALARRMIESRFAADPSIHAASRAAAHRLREDVISGAVDPWAPHPARVVRDRLSAGRPPVVPEQVDDPSARVPGTPPAARPGANGTAFRRLLSAAPASPGEAGGLVETRRDFRFAVTLDATPGQERLALYTVPKQSFDAWWKTVSPLHDTEAALVPAATEALTGPGILSGPVPPACPVDDTWSAMDPNSGPPQARMAHTLVWTGAEMIVWGGWSGASALSTGSLYDPVLDTWTPTATGGAPERRYWHAAVWTGTEMIVWGGADQGLYLITGGRYDPVADAWTSVGVAGAPWERASMAAAWTGNHLLVWGGFNGTIFGLTYLGDGGLYDPRTDGWMPVGAAGAPSARKPVAAWLDGRLQIWGGYDGSAYLSDGTLYDPNGDTWTTTDPNGAPSARSDGTLVWTGTESLLWGGEDATGPVGGGGAFDPATGAWRSLPAAGGPGARTLHTAVWTGDRMVVWGGWDGAALLDDGARYSPLHDTWTPVSVSGAPGARDQHGAVWAGDHMIVWGGWNGTSGDGDGGGYEVADLDGDGFGTCDGDCADADPFVHPGAPQFCDGLNNDCAHPGWPGLDGTNEADDDLDSISECLGDCDDGNAQVWATPGEVSVLDFVGGTVTLQWAAPGSPGGISPLYDTIRGNGSPQFGGGATCAETDGGDLSTVDSTVPVPGQIFYYLVRAVNGCPGGNGSLGNASDGSPRSGRDCP